MTAQTRDIPVESADQTLWLTDRAVIFLNHGSFGSCPRPVLDHQFQLKLQLERQPVAFMARDLEPLADEARTALAAFVHADPDGLAFATNATTAVSTVLAGFPLRPGDELLVTDHAYNACRNALDDKARRSDARVVVARIPFPLFGPQDVLDSILNQVTSRTRLALLDHVTSPTALVLPVTDIVSQLHARGVEVLLDGAHAPGMLPLDLDALGVAFYTGNCHKWMCCPKGSAFLWVRQDWRSSVRPLVVSHGANSTRKDRSRFRLEFDWTGTHDPTPYLCIPAALKWMEGQMPGGWPAVMAANRNLAVDARRLLCRRLGAPPPSPESMLGSMAAVPLPPDPRGRFPGRGFDDPLQQLLLEEYHIEVPVIPWPHRPHRLVRISAQRYNRPGQYDLLADALCSILAAEENQTNVLPV